MTEALALEDGERVLEIGTGSGYAAAILAGRSAGQFDEYIWFDETTAMTPFEIKTLEDLSDTYPFAL